MLPETTTPEKPNNKLTLRLDLRLVIVALLLVIVVLVMVWKPWQADISANSRTISVFGTAKVTATPDEFVFSPSYEFKNADKDAALKELTAKSAVVTAELKKLGVPSDKIKTDSNGYDSGMYYYSYQAADKQFSYTLSYTVTLNNEKLTQKVQDYLVTTAPTGSVSPYASFSTTKQKQLEAQARDEATKEARAKADQSAKNLGFTVAKVKSVNDSGFDGGIQPYLTEGSSLDVSPNSATDNLKVQSGQNDLSYSVTVVYYVR